MSVYQPILFGEKGFNPAQFNRYKPSDKKLSTNVVNQNATIQIYTDKLLENSPTHGGYTVPFETDGILKTVNFEINGVSNLQYYLYELYNLNDALFEIEL